VQRASGLLNAPACEKPAAPEPQPADATAARDPRKT